MTFTKLEAGCSASVVFTIPTHGNIRLFRATDESRAEGRVSSIISDLLHGDTSNAPVTPCFVGTGTRDVDAVHAGGLSECSIGNRVL
jgi:hypothetical protein